jgi:hypothetical protein
VLTPNTLNSFEAWASTFPPGPKKTYLKDLATAVQAKDVAWSGFVTIIVGLFHVHDDGTVYYNDFPVNSDTLNWISEGISALKTTSQSLVKTVLLSFGGGSYMGKSVSDADYANMKQNWPAVKAQMIELLGSANADGVDWDYEPSKPGSFDSDFIIRITNEMAAHGLVTAAPFTDQSNWLDVIKGTITPTGNNFAWWNLQLYGGDAKYGDWFTALINGSTGLPESQISTFLVPGYSPNCANLNDLTKTIQALKTTFPSLGGTFIWNYGQINCCAPDVSLELSAILSSNQGKPTGS